MENHNQEVPSIPWRIEDWFPDLGTDAKAKLKSFHESIQQSSKSLNLVSPKTLPFADALHFADSILASRIIYAHHDGLSELFDFGSGAGFPGVVFAILYPSVKVTLVDSDSKKIDFLKGVAAELGVKNVFFESKAIEVLAENSVSVAVTRGVSTISKNLLLARKCVVKGGHLYHLKGEEWGIELADIPSQLCSIWSPSLVGEYKLPIGNFKFAVVKTDKIA